MTRQEKADTIEALAGKLANAQYFYLTDASGLSVELTNKFRKICFDKNIEFLTVKNTLLRKAMDSLGAQYDEIHPALAGPTSIIFTETGNVPAKVLSDFAKTAKKPVLKGAWIDTAVYLGADQLEALKTVKSKNDLIADVVFLLQSPAKKVLSQLQSGGQTIAGLVKTLQEKAN